MFRSLDDLVLNLRFADVADICVVSILLYLGLQWLRKRAARAVTAALVLMALIYVCARVFNMYLTLLAFQTGLTVLVVSLVVIFQQDIRRTFEQLSSWRGFHANKPAERWAAHIDDLIETTAALANQKIGALMVLEGRQPLDPHIEGGVSVKGKISTPLLISIFHPATPGHDGAVVIHRDKIEMLGAYLPLSHNLEHIGKGGTRHAAGLGLSEACDALVIVVSEERGTISLAEEGNLQVMDSIAALKSRLEEFYLGKYPITQERGLAPGLRRNLALKSVSVGLAILLWFFVPGRVDTIQRSFDEVPVEFRNLPKHLSLASSEPAKVRLTLVGSEREFNAFDAKNLKISIDLQGYAAGEHTIELKGKLLGLPSAMSVRHFETPAVKVVLYRGIDTLDLKVKVIVKKDDVPKGYVLEKVEVAPDRIKFTLPNLGQPPPQEVETLPISLAKIKETTTVTAQLALPPNAEFAGGQPPEIRVTLHVSKKKDTTKPGD